jgi:hypothetical protein
MRRSRLIWKTADEHALVAWAPPLGLVRTIVESDWSEIKSREC